eukprot:693440_1
MERLKQQEYIQMMKQSKTVFCKSILDRISEYSEAVKEVDELAMQSTAQSHTAYTNWSKQELISKIEDLEEENNKLREIKESKDDELRSDIQYLLHVNPSEYNNVKRYIKHMKQQSMARASSIKTSLPRFSQQIIAPNTAGGVVPVRDSRRLPHPPRRNTNYDSDSIQMLHFVVSSVNWKVSPAHETLRVELLENTVAPIPHDMYQQMVLRATQLVGHVHNPSLTVDELLVLQLFCSYDEFFVEFSRAFTMGCPSDHRRQLYRSARVFHSIFWFKSVPISKHKLHHLLPPAMHHFGYIVKAIYVWWMDKYFVFNCSDDILQFACDDDLVMLSKNDSFHSRVSLQNYGWDAMIQSHSHDLFAPQRALKNRSIFDVLFYELQLYKLAHNRVDYEFLFGHITLCLDTLQLDLSAANPAIDMYAPSYYKCDTWIVAADDKLRISNSMYRSDKLYNWPSIPYLDCILNVNALLRVIANASYECKKPLQLCIEYRISIGYINNDDAQQQCELTSPAMHLTIQFARLMKILYCQLMTIVQHDLPHLQERITFCAEHKSFIILALIYAYNYKPYASIDVDEYLNKSLFEYLFFDCHHYELCDLFPRNHDLLLNPPHNQTLIQYDASKCHIILRAMPQLIHHIENQTFGPRRIMLYLSCDVELARHDDVEWKTYFINPELLERRQVIVDLNECINWNNILFARTQSKYPMILLYYKIECEFAPKYSITSTVRNIHISTEIDLELKQNETRTLNETLICDNLILHENATIYGSRINIKCNKLIDMREGASICADARRVIHIPYTNERHKGLIDYLHTHTLIDYLMMFCGGIGTRSNKMQNMLNPHSDNDCYFISGQEGVWFAIDLAFCGMRATHYALRHVDVSSNYLRNWQLEAKSSDDEWHVLRQHTNDATLNEAKQWAVWQIDDEKDTFYESFRIKMTGPNSAQNSAKHNLLSLAGVFANTAHNEYILCCGGFELFGDVVLRDNKSDKSHALEERILGNPVQFVYESDFDTNGILYWIGTDYGRREWRNPSQSLRVRVERGKQSEKGSVDDIVTRVEKLKDSNQNECCFLDYFVIDFFEIAICAHKYSLKLNDDADADGYCWCLKASHNKEDWTLISEHIDDEDAASFDIDCGHSYYRYFMIENMNLLNELHCCAFEIYGDIQYNPDAKYKLPQLPSGGAGGGIINICAPTIRLDRVTFTANGQDAPHGLSGGGGAAGNILIDTDKLTIIKNNDKCTMQCLGGKGTNQANNGDNGQIRLLYNTIQIGDDDDDDNIDINSCCNPKPLLV